MSEPRAGQGFFSRGGPTGFFSRGRGPSFAFRITEIQYLSTFKQRLAVCICLTNVTGSNHEEVSTNRDTLFLCVFLGVFLVLFHYFQRGYLSHSRGVGPSRPPSWSRSWIHTHLSLIYINIHMILPKYMTYIKSKDTKHTHMQSDLGYHIKGTFFP